MLKYLFKVTYTDGTTFRQDHKDQSKIDPTRSAFFDVLNSGKEVKEFELGLVKVNLLDGSFFVNGVNIQVGDDLPDFKRELVFYRQHQVDLKMNYEADKKGFFKFLNKEDGDDRVTYFLGYEMDVKGKKEKRIIGFK